ncbi:MAG: hypothetical protein IPI35_28675 [Deltaproteobacteria bacterium]|nr:hypothetical protein [Deltaproteobacteria bacterium]
MNSGTPARAQARRLQTDQVARLLHVEVEDRRVCAVEAVADQGEEALRDGKVAGAGLAVEAQHAARPVEVITTQADHLTHTGAGRHQELNGQRHLAGELRERAGDLILGRGVVVGDVDLWVDAQLEARQGAIGEQLTLNPEAPSMAQ